ncbi:MAG: hypothetical protein Q8K64_13215 [Sediminibacterium sp.]|nr:hypothetical protein [Sediminibacterium sp.]
MKKIAALLLFTVPFAFVANAQIKAECISGNCVNGKGIYKLANGAAYEGDFVDSLMSGFGIIVWQNRDKYIGDWIKGNRTGKGKYTWANGDIYEGDFINNIREGIGTMIYKNGDKYIGDWKKGEYAGKGKYIWANGDVYDGDYSKNNFEGVGIKVWKDGSKYSGEWKANKRNGKGKLYYINNYEYDGDFVDDLLDGKGTMFWIEGSQLKGDKFIGDFKKGQRTGKGKYIHANGIIEEGEFEFDKFIDPKNKPWTCVSGDCKNGIGTFNRDPGESYIGQFKDYKHDGDGTEIKKEGTYKGQFKNGEKNGIGTFTNNLGWTYTGNWKNDEIVDGTYNDGKGTSYTGHWKGGEYDGDGTEISAKFMGRIYKGEWEKGKQNGKGILLYPNGYYIKAKFINFDKSNIKYFNKENIQISLEEFNAKTPYQVCENGNCYNGLGVCDSDFGKNIFIGHWKNGKKEGFVADFEITGKYYYGIWKEDTLISKIDEKEAQKYLLADPKGFMGLIGATKKANENKRYNSLVTAAALIQDCTTSTCTTGDCKNGTGTWLDCKGNTYTGNWVNGQMIGKGKYTWANGAVYNGDFNNGTLEGKGKLIYANGDIYNGDWVNNTKQGKGEMTWQKKEYYKGDWVNNVRQGKGKSVDKEGRIREGDWVNDRFIISQAQREINEELRYKIKQLEASLESSRSTYLNSVSPNNAKDIEAYKRARAKVLDNMNYLEDQIYRLSKQIIE